MTESILKGLKKKWQNYANEYRYEMFVPGIHYQKVIEDLGIHNRNNFFNELFEITQNIVQNEDENLQSVCQIQKLQQTDPNLQEKQIIQCKANLYEYVEKNISLQAKPTTYVFYHKAIETRHKSWVSFMNFARKSKAWRIKVEQKSQ